MKVKPKFHYLKSWDISYGWFTVSNRIIGANDTLFWRKLYIDSADIKNSSLKIYLRAHFSSFKSDVTVLYNAHVIVMKPDANRHVTYSTVRLCCKVLMSLAVKSDKTNHMLISIGNKHAFASMCICMAQKSHIWNKDFTPEYCTQGVMFIFLWQDHNFVWLTNLFHMFSVHNLESCIDDLSNFSMH